MEEDSGSNTSRDVNYETPPTDMPLPRTTPQCMHSFLYIIVYVSVRTHVVYPPPPQKHTHTHTQYAHACMYTCRPLPSNQSFYGQITGDEMESWANKRVARS